MCICIYTCTYRARERERGLHRPDAHARCGAARLGGGRERCSARAVYKERMHYNLGIIKGVGVNFQGSLHFCCSARASLAPKRGNTKGDPTMKSPKSLKSSKGANMLRGSKGVPRKGLNIGHHEGLNM